jgi:Icc-related predicted phosphoesterase
LRSAERAIDILKIVIISDTHGHHKELSLPEGDILIHAGDVTGRGMESQVVDFLEWFAAQPHRHKIMIAGNHDFYFEQAPEEAIRKAIPDNIVYLNDSGTEVEGIRIWGSPVSTWFYDWAFSRHPGAEMQKHWDLVPEDTDILITHGPPAGIMDRITTGVETGCEILLETVQRIKPRLHLFGHIHEGYGKEVHDGVTYINAAVLNATYKLVNAPVVFEWSRVNA